MAFWSLDEPSVERWCPFEPRDDRVEALADAPRSSRAGRRRLDRRLFYFGFARHPDRGRDRSWKRFRDTRYKAIEDFLDSV